MASPFKSLAKTLKKPQVHWPIAIVLLGLVVGGLGYLLLGRVLDAVVIGLAVTIIGLMAVVLRAVFAWEREDRLGRGTEAPAAAAGAGAPSPGDSLEESVRRAVAEIRGSRLGAGGLEALPWLLLLGESGEGKTAAVRASGLALPAEYASRVTGAPTRDCDWWLANDAILLDLAGRFFACADEQTHDEWRTLLKQLRRQRPGCALNGVLFAISVDSLLGRSSAELDEAARSLRLRLNELTDDLGVDLPVYVMLTKIDHVEGFVECVNASPVVDPGDALGWSNDQRHLANAEQRVNEAFRGLLGRLESVLPELILRDPDRIRRRRIHAFPQELEEVVRAAARFIGRAFAPSNYDSAPFLRGVYLTSARREGSTLSPQLHRLGHDWARNQVDGSLADGGIFLRDLFHEIAIGDRDLALPADRFGPRARRVVHGAAGFVFLLLAGWWGVAFVSNLSGILQLRREAATVIAGASSLPSLESTRRAIHAQEDEFGLLRRGGLGGPMQSALARARHSFAWGFGREFEAPTKLKLQSVVRGFDDGAFEALAQLAADVTWLGSRADAAASSRPDLGRYAPISASTSDAAALRDGYDDFVRWAGHDEIQDRIDRERKVVAAGSARLLELRRLETWSESSSSYPPARYADVGLPAGEPPSGEVPGAYTRRGWDGLVKGLIEAIDSTGPASSIVKQFREGYVTRYESNWRAYLMSAPTPVRALADVKNSPYLALLEQLHANASVGLPRAEPAPAWLLALAESRRSEPLPEERPAAGAGDGQGDKAPPPEPPWKRYQLALDQVASDVQAAEEDAAAAVELAKDLASRKPTNFAKALKLVNEIVPAEGDPEAAEKIRKLLAMPILDGASAVLGRALDELDGRWAARIARPYSGSLSGQAMAQLYDGQGALAQFRNAELAAFYVDGRPVDVIGDRGMGLGRGFLGWMRSAERIQRSLYPGGVGGGVKVAARMQGVPSRVSGREQVRVSQRELRLRCSDGVQTFGYREGTAEHTFHWSPDCTELSLRIFAVEGGRERELLPKREWTGPMAFPAFLQAASRSGPNLQWTIRYEDPNLSILMAYRLRSGDELLSLSHAAPPRSMRN